MAQLVSDAQMAHLRDIAKLGMITPITIDRRSEAPPPVGGDYGDDFLAYTQTTQSRRTTVKGWFFSTPSQVQDVDTGAVVTVNTYRLFIPVDTDILPGDHVQVGALEFTVSDTTAETTWAPLLTASLRLRE